MLVVNGVEIDFDPSYPPDLERLARATEIAQKADQEADYPEVTDALPLDIDGYAKTLNIQLNILGNFIDDTFGDGVAERLLSNKPGLKEVLKTMNDLYEAIDAEGEELGVQIERLELRSQGKKYPPNRAARRAKK